MEVMVKMIAASPPEKKKTTIAGSPAARAGAAETVMPTPVIPGHASATSICMSGSSPLCWENSELTDFTEDRSDWVY